MCRGDRRDHRDIDTSESSEEEDSMDEERHGEDDMEDIIDENAVTPSRKTLARRQEEFLSLLPVSLDLRGKVLKYLVKDLNVKEILIDGDKVDNIKNQDCASRWSVFRYKKRAMGFLQKMIKKYNMDPSKFLLPVLQQLLLDDQHCFEQAGFSFLHDSDLPDSIRIKKISDDLATVLIRDRRTSDCRKVSIKHAVEVTKEALSSGKPIGISSLASAIGSSREFATKVLNAVQLEKTEELFKRKRRSDSIFSNDILERLTEFLSNAEHSRALPGNETVSVAYGKRLPKFLLKKSKAELAQLFKKENSDVTFSTRVILREWPANFVPPSHKDQERNVCPLHSNVRRCHDGLRQVGAAANLPKSVREMCAKTCQDKEFDPLLPVSWPSDCAMGICLHCPDLHVSLPENMTTMVTFLQWKKGNSSKCDRSGKPKEITSLFPVCIELTDAVQYFKNFFPQIKTHVFVASKQYQALSLRSASLGLGDLLTIEDYTMNFDIQYGQTTTASHYTANQITFAGYPIAVRYKDPITMQLAKGAILFISEDKIHDFEQVEKFERRALEICEEKCGQHILCWNRWSDNCAAQFKSKNTLGKLVQAETEVLLPCNGGQGDQHDLPAGATGPDNVQGGADVAGSGADCTSKDNIKISWDFLEANEAKNESDTIGGFSKTALRTVLLRNPDFTILSAEDLVSAIKQGLEKSTECSEKYSFLVVETIPRFSRSNATLELPVSGIRAFHSFTVHEGGILASKLTCQTCTVSTICISCQFSTPVITKDKVEAALVCLQQRREALDEDVSDEDSNSEETEVEDNASETEDDLASDACIDEDRKGVASSEEDDDITEPGSIVWVCWGSRWYPAKVVLLAEVPEPVRRSLRKDTGRSVVVKFFGDEDYSRVDIGKMEELGMTSTDLRRSRSPGIMLKYNLALADLKYRGCGS